MSRYQPRHERRLTGAVAFGKSALSLLRRVLRDAGEDRWRLVWIALLGLAATPLALLIPVPLKVAVDSVVGSAPLPGWIAAVTPSWMEESKSALIALVAGMTIVVAVLSALQQMGQYVLETATGESITLNFRTRLLAHAQRLSFAFHDKRGTADSIYRIQWDAPAAQYIAIYGLLPLVLSSVTLVAMIAVVVAISPQLALVALAVAPLIYIATYSYGVRMRPSYSRAKELESSALSVVQEVLTQVRVVASFGRESDERERFSSRASRSISARVRLAVAEMGFKGGLAVLTAIGTAAVLSMGLRNVLSGDLSMGDLLLVIGYLAQLYGPLNSISGSVASLQNYLASAQRVYDLMDEEPEVVERPDAVSISRASGNVEFRGVTFGYEPERFILHDATFRVRTGARVGIVGKTGAGKTTLVNLLMRFYDPESGGVFLDGRDARDFRLADFRRQFSVVLQEPVLFSASLADNIAYARPDATEAEILAAARAADAMDFIRRLPDGLETVVGERGMSLSGGERQRISIARAFLKDAPILILDEPTSSVDTETEANIMTAMRRLMEGRTTFMIAHRTSTLAGCDAILTVRDGQVLSGRAVVADSDETSIGPVR